MNKRVGYIFGIVRKPNELSKGYKKLEAYTTNSVKVMNVEIMRHINMPIAFNAICVWAYIYAQRVQRVEMDSEPIGGLDKIVEIDESEFGKRKYKKGI